MGDRSPGSARSGVRAAFTLIELMASIGVITVVLSLILPAIGAARQRAIMVVCVTHARDIGTIVTLYANDSADSFPSWLGRASEYAADRSIWWKWGVQGASTLYSDRWFEVTGLPTTSEIMYCPANQFYPDAYLTIGASDYALSTAAYARPEYFDPSLPWSDWGGRFGGRVQRFSAVAYPGAKVGILETDVWHGWKGRYGTGVNLFGMQYKAAGRPSSVWYMDGHAGMLIRDDAIPGVNRWPYFSFGPFSSTPMGVLGRDIR